MTKYILFSLLALSGQVMARTTHETVLACEGRFGSSYSISLDHEETAKAFQQPAGQEYETKAAIFDKGVAQGREFQSLETNLPAKFTYVNTPRGVRLTRLSIGQHGVYNRIRWASRIPAAAFHEYYGPTDIVAQGASFDGTDEFDWENEPANQIDTLSCRPIGTWTRP